jgi:ribosomal protein S18 acetylase RimI-like enzyme
MEEFAYAENAIQKDLLDSGIEYFIAADNGTPVGYLKIILAAQLVGFETLEALEVERIYLYKYAIGKGIGRQLMQVAMHKAKEFKKSIIFLKTMDSSKEAIEFYIKLGFSICGSLQLPMPAFSLMKEEYRGMFILKREVEE